jgi:sec-independent protein translocase protein TatA
MNATLGIFNLGGGEVFVILAVVLILFGAKKIPELAKGMGQGIKEFKKATREVSDELHNSMSDNPPPPPQRTLPPAATVESAHTGSVTPRSPTPTPTDWNRSPENSSATPPQKS